VTAAERAIAKCSRCGSTWTALSAAHCGECCVTFSGVNLFDRHRYVTRDHGGCVDPAEMMEKGRRVAFYRNGMWRGPELSEEQRNQLYGRSKGA